MFVFVHGLAQTKMNLSRCSLLALLLLLSALVRASEVEILSEDAADKANPAAIAHLAETYANADKFLDDARIVPGLAEQYLPFFDNIPQDHGGTKGRLRAMESACTCR